MHLSKKLIIHHNINPSLRHFCNLSERAISADLQVQTRLLQQLSHFATVDGRFNYNDTVVSDRNTDESRRGGSESAFRPDPDSRLRSETTSESDDSVTMILLRGMGLLDPMRPNAPIDDFSFPWQQQQQQQPPPQKQQQQGYDEGKSYEVDAKEGYFAGGGSGGLMPLCVALHVMAAAELFSEDARHELGDDHP